MNPKLRLKSCSICKFFQLPNGFEKFSKFMVNSENNPSYSNVTTIYIYIFEANQLVVMVNSITALCETRGKRAIWRVRHMLLPTGFLQRLIQMEAALTLNSTSAQHPYMHQHHRILCQCLALSVCLQAAQRAFIYAPYILSHMRLVFFVREFALSCVINSSSRLALAGFCSFFKALGALYIGNTRYRVVS